MLFSLFFAPRFTNTMTEDSPDKSDRSFRNSLYPEDQKKVDEFVNRGINSVERKPFRPLRLFLLLIAVVTASSAFSIAAERVEG